MSAALVAAWVGAFVAPVCVELLKMFLIHKGWYPSQPAIPPSQPPIPPSPPPIPPSQPANTPSQPERTIGILEEILVAINTRVGETQALTDTLEDLSQRVGRLIEIGEAHSREGGVLIDQHMPIPPVPGAAAHPVDG